MVTTVITDNYYQFSGLSTDTKPLPDATIGRYIDNGSIFFEMDTSKVYMFDEQNNRWIKLGR